MKVFNESGEKEFQCNNCENVYTKRNSALKHFYSSHRDKKFKCDRCSKMFAVNSELSYHLKTCNGIFSEAYSLTKMKGVAYNEILMENGKKVFECSKCEKTYENQESIRQHFHATHGDKKFKCHKCHKMFLNKSKLRRHLKTCNGVYKKERNITMNRMKDIAYKENINKDGEKEFRCNKCENVYEKQDSIRRHFHFVHGVKKFKCENCYKTFAFNSDLKSHVNKCHGFSSQNRTRMFILRDHEMFKEIDKDNGEKEFQCVKCENIYVKKESALKHFHVRHREKKFKCEKCSKMFPIRSILRKHFNTCNGEIISRVNKLKDIVYKDILNENGEKEFQCYKCEKCNKMFAFKTDSDKHVKRCNGISNATDKKILKDVAYKEILNKNGEKQFKCSNCETVFEKQDNVRRHFHVVHEEKKFKCDKCSKMFSFSGSLRKHLKICNGQSSQNHNRISNLKKDDMFKVIHKDDGEKEFRCAKCESVYANKESAGKHFHRKHREKKF